MAFDVSLLTPYTDETSQALIAESIGSVKTIGKITVIPNVKNKTAINLTSTDLVVTAAAAGWSPDGDVTLYQRDIDVFSAQTQLQLNPQTLEQYWMAQTMKPGTATEVPFQTIIDTDIAGRIATYIEKDIWMGQQIGTPVVGMISGFIELLKQEEDIVYVAAAAPAHTASNIVAHVDAMITAVPENIMLRNDLVLFMSPADYKMYTAAMRTANMYVPTADGANFEHMIYGTNITAIATPGLSGSHNWVLTYAPNLVFGTDLVGEDSRIETIYNPYTHYIQVQANWKYGVQVYEPKMVVTNFDAEV